MKNYGSTAVMAAIVAAVAGFAFFEYKKGEGDEAKKAQEDRLFPESDANFTTIKLGSDKDTMLELVKDKGAWNLKVPVQDSADDTASDGLVGELASQKAKTLETEGGPPKWTEYGLEPDQARHLDLITSSGKTYALLVSLKPAFDGSSFLRFNDKLMLGSTAWVRIIGKNATDLRNKRFLPTPLNIAGIKIESPGKKPVILKKEKDQWQFGGGVAFPLDSSRVENLINDVKALRALDFVSETQNAKALADAGLTHPLFKMVLDLETKDPARVELTFGERKGSTDVFVTVSNRPQIFKVAKMGVEKLNKTAEDFRDRKQPFQFDLEQVKNVNVETSVAKVQIKKDGTSWALAQPEKGKELDMERLQDFFDKVKSLEADTFFAPNQGKGLNPPKNAIVFTGGDGKVVFKLAWGDEFKKDANTAPVYFAKTSNSKEVLGVKTGSLMTLPIQTLVKSSESPPAAPGAATAPAPGQMPPAVPPSHPKAVTQ